MGTRFANTIANPMGAKQEAPTAAVSTDNVVTAVRMFSESLLANRVSKEVKQEVKALVAHMEILIARRRMAANRARTPSVTETRVALRNLKRFLEREANKEREKVKKPSASCTTDTLESSCSHVQAFSPSSERTRSLRSLSVDLDVDGGAAVCGSRGDSSCRRHAAMAAEKRRLGRWVNPPDAKPAPEQPLQQQQKQQRKERSSRSRPLCGPARLVQLTCSDRLPLLLLPNRAEEPAAGPREPAAAPLHVHLLAEWASPTVVAEAAAAAEMQLLPAGVHFGRYYCPAVCLHRTPAGAERAPPIAPNPQLEDERPSGMAIEKTMEQPVLDAECSRSNASRIYLDKATRLEGGCACRGDVRRAFNSEKAIIEEQQANSNCATVSSHVAIVSWAKATTITDVAETEDESDAEPKVIQQRMATRNRCGSNQFASTTCSCPSDSDGRKASGATNVDVGEEKKGTEETADLPTSSAQLQPHGSIQAAPVQLEQRVCESSSLEIVASSTNILTLGECPSVWQQPLFRILDLMRLVRTAAPLTRSESPTEALGIAADNRAGDELARDGNVDKDCGRSQSTLEVVDRRSDPGPASPASSAPNEAARPAVAASAATPDPAAQGPTWSSCEMGESSGFTKLLLTLDKAAKRRRDQARAKRLWQKQRAGTRTAAAKAKTPPDANLSAVIIDPVTRGRRTCRSRNNSSGRAPRANRPHLHYHQTARQQSTSTQISSSQAALDMRRQAEALGLAAKSLAGLAKNLQLCVRRVHDAAHAINNVM